MHSLKKQDEYPSLADEEIVSALVGMLAESNSDTLEDASLEQEQVDLSLKEMLIGNLYVRTILIPKGTFLVSKVWLSSYVDIMISGKIAVMTPDGVNTIEGHNLLRGKAARKRCGYAYEDTVWITVHQTDDFTLRGIEDRMTVSSVDDAKAIKRLAANIDYQSMLESLGVTDEEIQPGVTDEETLVKNECLNTYISDSDIHGDGLFASVFFKRGEVITAAAVDGLRTMAGRYTNHSCRPNAQFVYKDANNAIVVALDDIYADQEILIDYRSNINTLGRLSCQQQ